MTRSLAAFVGLLTLLPCHAADPIPHQFLDDRALELVVMTKGQVARIRIEVTADGQPVTKLWDDAFSQLLALYDRNVNATLDRDEAARLPTEFALRQVLWGRSIPHTGHPPVWAEVDRRATGAVNSTQLAAYYRNSGLGRVSVAVGQSASSAQLTDALWKHLDLDADGRVSDTEWKQAPQLLAKLDRNDDELISPGELVQRTAYPGVTGSQLLLSPRAGEANNPAVDCPVLLLPNDPTDIAWAASLLSRRDLDGDKKLAPSEAGLASKTFAQLDSNRDGHLTVDELAGWRFLPADYHWQVDMGRWPDGAPQLRDVRESKTPQARLTAGFHETLFTLRGDPGQLPAAQASAQQRVLDLFAEADIDRDGFVSAPDLTRRNLYELQQLLTLVDRDQDGRLSRGEVTAWLNTQAAIARGQVLLTLGDFGNGLYEWLDTNHDGMLSAKELDAAGERVKTSSIAHNGKAAMPRYLSATLSRGQPKDLIGQPSRAGPSWFQAMDRNGDGEVSRKEFVGSESVFKTLDQDRNGRLSPSEAEHFKK